METPDPAPLDERREWRLTGVIAFALFAVLLFAGALRILWPFLSAICLSVILVVLTYDVYERLCDRLNGRSALAAVLMLVGITFLVVLCSPPSTSLAGCSSSLPTSPPSTPRR